jgi:hypothetical protein
MLVWAWAGTPAQALQATAAQVKAAYLLKFPGFVEWPPGRQGSQETPFVIGVLDADDVAHALEGLAAGVKVMGRPVQVLQLRREDTDAAPQLLYLGASARDAARAVARARSQGALVVGDRPHGLAEGAALQFIEVDGRIRFEASPDNAAQSGLKLSARLLAVAARVDGGPP